MPKDIADIEGILDLITRTKTSQLDIETMLLRPEFSPYRATLQVLLREYGSSHQKLADLLRQYEADQKRKRK